MLQHNFCKRRKINWLTSKNILNVTATYYQCLGLIAQNTISTWSNLICYPFSSMRGICNLPWLKKRTRLCPLSSVTFRFWIFWTFSVEQQALTPFLKFIKHQKLIAFFPMNGSTVRKRWTTVNFPLTRNFSANFGTGTPWKRTIQIIKNYLAADWRLKEHYLKWSFPNLRLQEKKTTNICLLYGIMRICAHLKTFYAGTTTNTLSQHSKQIKKCLLFVTRKNLTCWWSGVHFRTCGIFGSTNLPVPDSIQLLKPIKTCCKRFEKVWLVVLLSSAYVRL